MTVVILLNKQIKLWANSTPCLLVCITCCSAPQWLNLPVKVWMCEGDPWLYGNHSHRLHRVFIHHVRAFCCEGAEIMSPSQQGSGIPHGSHIQHSEKQVILKDNKDRTALQSHLTKSQFHCLLWYCNELKVTSINSEVAQVYTGNTTGSQVSLFPFLSELI